MIRALFFSLILIINFIPSKSMALWRVHNEDLTLLQKVINSANNCDYVNKYRHKAHDKTVNALIEWYIITNFQNCSSSKEIFNFMTIHPNWPDISKIQVIFENKINNLSPEINDWFHIHPPITGKANVIYNLGQIREGGEEKIIIRKIWHQADMTKDDEAGFLKRYKIYLQMHDYIRRIERLIWEDKINLAKNNLNYLDKKNKQLYEKIIQIRENSGSALRNINNILQEFSNNELLLNSLAKYYFSQKQHGQVIKYIKFADSTINIMHPDKWHKMRNYEARELFEIGNYLQSYNLIKNHKLKSGEKFADSEWFSGWLALRFLNKPNFALNHFKKLEAGVHTSASKVRANYWLARTENILGNKELATKYFQNAARFNYYYYGQLAGFELGKQAPIKIGGNHDIQEEDRHRILNNSVAKAAFILIKSGDYQLAEKFGKQVMKTLKTPGEIYLLTEISGIERALAVKYTKEAGKFGVMNQKLSYPLLDHSCCGKNMIHYLAHGIIRQESNFDSHAVSSAGAQGLMQIMPERAKIITKKLNTYYRPDILKIDEHYNVRLGTFHLEELMYEFDNNYILAISAYNAGPRSAVKFMDKFGDPRLINNLYKLIDWIESIPYEQTRSYVQMVLANMQVYYSLDGSKIKLTDLIRK